ncbi:unnamed protein product [Ectocarpus sp. 12 AP-2014]
MADGPPSSIDIDGSSSTGAGGPPSSIDVGGGTGSSSYWEQRFGDDGDFDPSNFIPSYTTTDKVLAIFRLAVGAIFVVLGSYALVRFYRSRWILDIRTRSAHLVMLGGVAVILSMLTAVNGALNIVWESGLDWFWVSLLLFFVSPALFGSYICRALRLAVVFHPRAKRALPWLIPERNYVAVLMVASCGMLAIPLYHEHTLEVWEVIPKQTDILIWESIAFAVVQACIYPFIRNVDDLFSISKELAVVTAATILLAVGQKLEGDYGGVYERRWLGNNLFLLFAAVVFSVSVVDPLRRLAFDPLAATKRNYADRVLLSRGPYSSAAKTASWMSTGKDDDGSDDEEAMLEEGAPRGNGRKNPAIVPATDDTGMAAVTGDDDGATAAAAGTAAGAAPACGLARGLSSLSSHSTGGNRRDALQRGQSNSTRGRGGGGGGGSGGQGRGVMEVWNFERLARTPLLAAAFEDYSKRALCHESVLFLSEVSRYQNDDYATPTRASSESSCPTQFGTFCYITDTFIKGGSPEEVNISDADKKAILEVYHKGEETFGGVNEEDRRMIFSPAYLEVKSMLEANLLRRFLNTDRFKSVRMQRENVQAMMDSPPMLPAGVGAV